MTRRLVAVLAVPALTGDGLAVEPGALRAAMLEDVCDLVAGLPLVEPVLVVDGGDRGDGLAELVAPGTPVVEMADGMPVDDVVAALGRHGADEVVLLTGDAPDLPALLVGKVFRGLGSADVAVVPADDGGLVALGLRLPTARWYARTGVDLDTADAVRALRAAAPSRRALSVAPGWHRVRHVPDLARLDPGLEGWDATRTLLAAH